MAAQEVRIVYVGPTEQAVWRGIAQGLHEANLLGGFTGYTFAVPTMSPDTLTATGTQPPPLAVVAAADAATLRQLSAHFASSGVAVFNLTADDETLRQACLGNLFHIAPSARMKADAVAQWQQKHPQARVQAQAWHYDYTKFAARDLNNRFRKAQGQPMDDDAWAGWAALKLLSEAVVRVQTAEPARLLAYVRDELEFDGQKGVPQTFRNNGQMRQPLLLVEDGKLVGEAPVRGVSDDLDSLGLPSCTQ
jgi:ABC-type branched-subunit amino acid transport system substrate-binding protein